jgi:predicted amidohydrolase
MADAIDRDPAGGLRVGACQTPEILADSDAALTCIAGFARQGADRGVHLLLFPECFLQGYLVDPDHVRRHALDFSSPDFAAVLRRLARIEATIVVGLSRPSWAGTSTPPSSSPVAGLPAASARPG